MHTFFAMPVLHCHHLRLRIGQCRPRVTLRGCLLSATKPSPLRHSGRGTSATGPLGRPPPPLQARPSARNRRPLFVDRSPCLHPLAGQRRPAGPARPARPGSSRRCRSPTDPRPAAPTTPAPAAGPEAPPPLACKSPTGIDAAFRFLQILPGRFSPRQRGDEAQHVKNTGSNSSKDANTLGVSGVSGACLRPAPESVGPWGTPSTAAVHGARPQAAGGVRQAVPGSAWQRLLHFGANAVVYDVPRCASRPTFHPLHPPAL